MNTLKDQIAVVTGAGSGIGKGIALALGEAGASVRLVGRRVRLLEDVAAQLAASGATASAHPTDVADQESIQNLTRGLLRATNGVDILVHCAGMVRLGTVADALADDFDAMYRTNVLGPYLLTRELLPALRERKGQIVFMNSSVSMMPRAGVSQYAATKQALQALADSLRAEVNADGIRVLSVYPGRTASPAQEEVHAQERKSYRPERLLQPQDIAQMVVTALCLPRTAEVTDLHIRPMLKSDGAERDVAT
jgi:NADP-dependent 3-hydroxy acid dehydrogenase YdfG